MVIWLILGILLVILAICLGIAIIHESDEKIGIIISYVGFITGLLLIIGYICRWDSIWYKRRIVMSKTDLHSSLLF